MRVHVITGRLLSGHHLCSRALVGCWQVCALRRELTIARGLPAYVSCASGDRILSPAFPQAFSANLSFGGGKSSNLSASLPPSPRVLSLHRAPALFLTLATCFAARARKPGYCSVPRRRHRPRKMIFRSESESWTSSGGLKRSSGATPAFRLTLGVHSKTDLRVLSGTLAASHWLRRSRLTG